MHERRLTCRAAATRHADRTQAIARGRWQASTIFLTTLAAYFLLQIALRLYLSDSLDLDEAEQAFAFQQLRFGYGTQPPLYAWLQSAMFTVFGVNLFALAALKNALLFGTYAAVFHTARPLIGVTGAMAASASLLLLPAIGWESQRDLTHSVLLTFMASASLWAYFALLRKPDPWRHVGFGLLLASGLLAKYNFAVFVVALAAASLLVEEHRRMIWTSRLWITAAIASFCLLPHALWLVLNLGAAVDGTLQKMGPAGQSSYLHNIAAGMGSIWMAALAFVTPLWLVYLWLCRRDLRLARIDSTTPNARFFLFLFAGFFALLTLLVLSGEVRNIKSRWMMPLLFPVPLAFFVVLPALPQAKLHRGILRVTAFIALAVLLALPARVHVGASAGKTVRAHHPYPQLADAIAHDFPQVRTVIADTRLIAGNLFFQRPERQTLLLDELLRHPQPLHGNVLLIVRSDAPEDWLERFRAAYPAGVVKQQGVWNLPLRYGSEQTMSFAFASVVFDRHSTTDK